MRSVTLADPVRRQRSYPGGGFLLVGSRQVQSAAKGSDGLQCDQTILERRRYGRAERRLHAVEAWPAVGSILHVPGPGPNVCFRVIEVWESREEAERFIRARLRPAFESVGIPGPSAPPQFWPVHNVMRWAD